MQNKIMPEFLAAAAMSITHLTRLNKTVTIITGLAIPTIVGIFCTYYETLAKVNPILFWAPVALFIGLGIIYSVSTWDIALPAESLMEYLESRDRQKYLESAVLGLMTLQELISVWRALVDEYMSVKVKERSQIIDAIRVMMETLVKTRDDIFGFNSTEIWSIAVYIYNQDTDMLTPTWRECHKDHPNVSGESRAWKPGVGHIGLAFLQNQTKITADARMPEVASLLRVPAGQERTYDDATYVSFVSQPIPRSTPGRPWGVLVATSSKAGRFNEANGLALRHAAAFLGTLLSLAYEGPLPI